MARARNIKPAFFVNDDLAENNCALGRILFIGLWTIADYKGDLEWRAGRIKTQLLPYDDCDIKKLAINLDKSGFVRFYSDGEKIYLNITNFVKHQNPHKNERDSGSDIPCFNDDHRQLIDLSTLTINRDKSGLSLNKAGSAPADSLIPITDSLNLNPHTDDFQKSSSSDFLPSLFDKFWQHYKTKQGKKKAQEKFNIFLKGRSEGRARFWMNLMLAYYMDCLEREVVGYSALHAATYIHNKRWEDNPEFMAKFKAEWLEQYGEKHE